MQTITTIGFDIAKSVFQVHGVDASGQVVIRRQLKRQSVLAFFQKLPPCLVGIEACALVAPLDRQEEAGAARHPALAVERDAAARHDHVDVRVMGHGRAPAVQHGGMVYANTRAPE